MHTVTWALNCARRTSTVRPFALFEDALICRDVVLEFCAANWFSESVLLSCVLDQVLKEPGRMVPGHISPTKTPNSSHQLGKGNRVLTLGLVVQIVEGQVVAFF